MARSPSRRSRSPDGYRASSRRDQSERYDRSHASSARRPDDRRSDRYEERYDDRDRDRDRERRERDPRDARERDGSHRSRDGDYRYDDRRDRDRYSRDDRRRDDRDDRDERRRHGDERYGSGRDRDERRRDEYRSGDRDRDRDDRERTPVPRDSHRASPAANSPRPAGKLDSPVPDGRPLTAQERLALWKKQRGLDTSKTRSATPDVPTQPPKPSADVKPFAAIKSTNGALPSGPSPSLSFGGVKTIGLPTRNTNTKRAFGVLDDDDDEGDRKLQKLDLPEIDPEVQSGPSAEVAAIDGDLAAEEVDEDKDVKPDVPEAKEDKMDVDPKVEEEDEEDELDAYMRQNNQEVRKVNVKDAVKGGLINYEGDSDDEVELKDTAGDELAKAEALLQAAASKSRKKDLPTPDHAKIEYEPFRKEFYSAPVEANEMTEEDVELMRLTMGGIKVRGKDAPRPVKNWGAFGLPMACLDVIRKNGWAEPTSIQAQAIPAIMSGRDVVGIAKTGSGKTVAFLLPLFRHVKDQRPVINSEGPIALILSPTRELATQIYREAKQFMGPMNVRVSGSGATRLKVAHEQVTCCVGGQSISEDISNLKKGAEVVVCTPGRMIDLLTANNGRVSNLRRVTFLVLDEADRMFDMGFEPQVMKIINNTRPTAQKVLFSATFAKIMDGLTRKILNNGLEITVGGRSVVAPEIDQRVEVRDQDTKWNRLLEILGERNQTDEEGEDSRVLIFVDRQESADDLSALLNTRSYPCASLHGGREQIDRDLAIKHFKTGDIPVIVATSVAARGLDVKELRLVINYDCPNHMEDYVHRAGRTGRAGNKGTCITFITKDQERYSVDIVRALEASNAFIPPELKEMSDKFLEKIKSKQAKKTTGFGGRGLERIEKKREEKDRTEKHTYGDTSEALALSSREGAVIPYKPKESIIKPPDNSMKGETDYTFTEIHVEIVEGPAPDRATNPLAYSASGGGTLFKDPSALPGLMKEALQTARREGRMVDASRLSTVIAALRDKMDKGNIDKNQPGWALLSLPAPAKPKDPDATDYHAIFPINDYPQKARWKVTNKEQMTLLVEHSNASITMRGNYYPPGEEPVFGGEPKLHLLVESNDREKVQAALDEIRRNLVEASMAALNNADRGVTAGSGRYAV